MNYDWDEARRIANLAKHGVDFSDAVGVFFDDYAITRLRGPIRTAAMKIAW